MYVCEGKPTFKSKRKYIRGEKLYYFTLSGLKNFANFVIYVAVFFVFSLGGG